MNPTNERSSTKSSRTTSNGLAGNTTYGHGLMRVAINGQPVGYHLYFEQPNANFFKRNKINHKGDLYKLIWTGDAQMRSSRARTTTMGTS